jgi:predicted lipid-binding transport protein (Tim44 family)
MGYVIAGILVLLLVAGFITFVVMNAMRKSGPTAPGGGPPGVGQDPTPLGDTTEHAGAQTRRGTTAEDPERNPGEDDASQGFDPARPAKPEDRQLRDAGADSGPQPDSERLADRPR